MSTVYGFAAKVLKVPCAAPALIFIIVDLYTVKQQSNAARSRCR
jgi:hypothetical protein